MHFKQQVVAQVAPVIELDEEAIDMALDGVFDGDEEADADMEADDLSDSDEE